MQDLDLLFKTEKKSILKNFTNNSIQIDLSHKNQYIFGLNFETTIIILICIAIISIVMFSISCCLFIKFKIKVNNALNKIEKIQNEINENNDLLSFDDRDEEELGKELVKCQNNLFSEFVFN